MDSNNTTGSMDSNNTTDYRGSTNNEVVVYEGHQYKSENHSICLSVQMEYMEYTLKRWCIDINPTTDELYMVLEGLLDGIEYLHTRSPPIIHCDIKPDNILIKMDNQKWVAKLADFGLVTELDGIWRPTKYEGTFMYRAPEVVSDDSAITPQVDIYSLGIVLYEISQNFHTEMERVSLLTKYREGVIKTATILDNMVNMTPGNRPSISEVKKYLQNIRIR